MELSQALKPTWRTECLNGSSHHKYYDPTKYQIVKAFLRTLINQLKMQIKPPV